MSKRELLRQMYKDLGPLFGGLFGAWRMRVPGMGMVILASPTELAKYARKGGDA